MQAPLPSSGMHRSRKCLKDELVELIYNRVAFLGRICKESLNPPMGLRFLKWWYAAEMS